MRCLLGYLLLIITTVSYGQILTDIASDQNIVHIQYAANHFANGGAFYDFNEDGWDDLTLPVSNDSIAFYINNNGILTKTGSYVYAPGKVRQLTWVDYDNNGTLDLFITFQDIGIRMYQNTGNFNFIDVTNQLGITTTPFNAYGAAFADADQDGDLDFYVCVYEHVEPANPTPLHNLFYVNNNNASFTEMSVAMGVDNGTYTSFMPVWFDYNNDNILELHVINDRDNSGNACYTYSAGSYSNVAANIGIENFGHNPMSNSVSDYDNDGDFDIFESDIANGGISSGFPIDYKLYTNQNGSSFINTANAMGLDTNFFAWGGLWVDVDNDGFEDLYVATSDIDPSANMERNSLYYHNNGGMNFQLRNDSIIGDILCSSYSPLKGDINNDGFYDIVVVNDGVPPNVFLNSGTGNNFIKITPIGTVSNRNGIGARVEVFSNGIHQTQMVFCGEGICAQNSQHKIFGVGTAMVVDSVVITFPSGIQMKAYDLDVNQNYAIKEKVHVAVPLIQGVNSLQKCMGDTISLGIVGYTNYVWNNGETTPTIEVATSGYYSFQAENATGDTLYVSSLLYVNFNSPLVYQEIIHDASCGLGSYGSCEIVPMQASMVDSIYWSDGFVGSLNNNLMSGNYSYTLVSIYGCTQTDTFSISSSPLFTTQYLVTPSDETNNGSVDFFIWGGNPPFTYLLGTSVVSSTINGLAPGVYTVIIEDAEQCSDTIVVTIPFEGTTGLANIVKEELSIYYIDGTVNVCHFSSDGQFTEMQLFDMTGQIVPENGAIEQKDSCLQQSYRLSKGIYLVELRGSEVHRTKLLFIH